MDVSTFAILLQDGITTGAIYALLSLALVLVFSVTRVIFLPQGELMTFGAISLALIQTGEVPSTVYLLVVLGLLATAREVLLSLRDAERRRGLPKVLGWMLPTHVAAPLALWFIAKRLPLADLPMVVQIALAMAIVVPMAPMLYRLAYQPLAHASVLILLIVSLGVHLALVGLGLMMFGPEGYNTTPFTDRIFTFGDVTIPAQSVLVVVTVGVLVFVMSLYFERTLSGKALRATAVNRLGARLVGIGTDQAGRLSFTLSAAIGVLCGVLIAPFTILNYDSGFLIALRGFVAAIFGGLTSYVAAGLSAVGIGLVSSFSSFWASAFKEVIVFSMIIPVLLWRSARKHSIEGEE